MFLTLFESELTDTAGIQTTRVRKADLLLSISSLLPCLLHRRGVDDSNVPFPLPS